MLITVHYTCGRELPLRCSRRRSERWTHQMLKADKLRLSYALRGAKDNPWIESFNSRFKEEVTASGSSGPDRVDPCHRRANDLLQHRPTSLNPGLRRADGLYLTAGDELCTPRVSQ